MPKKKIGLITLAVFSIASYFLLPYIQNNDNKNIVEKEEQVIDSVEVSVPEPTMLYGMVVDSMVVIEDKIKRNQNISEILSAHNISHQDIFKLANISKNVFDVRKIAANKKYTLICEPDSLKTIKALVYEHNPIEYVVFSFQDSVTVEKREKPVQVVEKGVSGVIESSLSLTMNSMGLTPQLTNDFVDVFAWQIDFFRLQKGDRFKVIFEDQIVEGKSIGIGDIKAIYFEHHDNPYYAYHFDQGNGIDYFDEEGNSLRKALLKYPLKFSRISSRYSGRRYHPVQKRYKAHRGTDFAAPKGTPIRSVGDGIVVEARFKKYNGNYVKIKHNATYTTQYLHMSKIASGIKPGVRVRQDQTIGFVGSTGLATGNHLCYRFWKNGVQIDALKVQLPPSQPIAEDNTEEFNITKEELTEKLSRIPWPQSDENPILASTK